jgi:hypothetical protein
MLSAIRKRMSYANVLASLALFFAMSGGALAASHYLITKTSQIKPSVLASLKGKAGPAGPKGAPGATGAAGAQGPAGTNGSNGSNGTSGTNGTSVTTKELPAEEGGKCPSGGVEVIAGPSKTPVCNGQTGFTASLPEGKTETGTWSAKFPPATAETSTLVSFSFPIPLAAGTKIPRSTNVHYISIEAQTNKTAPSDCSGKAEEPTAEAGSFCVYEGSVKTPVTEPSREPVFETFFRSGASGAAGEGAGPEGAVGRLIYPEGSEENSAFIYGTWAVTAP